MANRPSRIVISIPTASYDGRYWGRYPHGDKPVVGAEFEASAQDVASAAAGLTASIRLGGAASDVAAASAGMSSSIKLAAGASDVASATASFGGSISSPTLEWTLPSTKADGSALNDAAYVEVYRSVNGSLPSGSDGTAALNDYAVLQSGTIGSDPVGKLADLLATQTTYTDPNPPSGTHYYYVVVLNEDGTPSNLLKLTRVYP